MVSLGDGSVWPCFMEQLVSRYPFQDDQHGGHFRGIEEKLKTRTLQEGHPYTAKLLGGAGAPSATPQLTDSLTIFLATGSLSKSCSLFRKLWVSQEEPDHQGCKDAELIRKRAADPPVGPDAFEAVVPCW